jgi:signal transduction histidine kinase/DNA-binding NarL/FixJ family response regulator
VDATACTILLVDDEPANLDLLVLMLRGRGYRQLVRVQDAREAIAAFDAERPDLVLLDLHMPYRTGFEVLGDIGTRVPADDFLPVLVLTADATAQARERALAGGAHDFVLKPFDRMEVLLRVRNLLHTRLLHLAQRKAREAAERAAARDRLLAEASRLLGASFDSATALGQVARLLVEPHGGDAAGALADACTVTLAERGEAVGADDTARPLATAGQVDGAGAWAHALDAALVTGAPASTSADTDRDTGAGHGASAAAGVLRLGRARERPPFDAADRALARELARRAALALENARLFRAAQEALAARDRVLAVVAHDLRSPLTALRFDLEMLRVEPAGALDASDVRTLVRAERAAGRMDALIEDLLDVARLERGALAVERRPHDMGALLEEAALTLRSLVEGHGLRFEVSAEGPAPVLAVDATRVLQAVSNLVGNAAKFSRDGGRVALAWGVAGGELRITVRDDGPGIPPEQVQHIFGAFWQARHADRRGLGLGLAIARGIAEAHDGRIWVESVPGAGSTFVLALPVPDAAPA